MVAPVKAAPGAAQQRPSWALWRQFDPVVAVAAVLVAAFGCLMVYTATRDQLEAAGLSPTYYLQRQAVFVVIGIAVMLVVAAIDYHHLQDWAPAIYGLCILALLAVLVVGHRSRGAQAWFQFGSFQLEPSEFAKVGLIVAVASYCASARGRLSGRALLTVLGMSVVPFVLIYKQPDLGTALTLAAVLVVVLLIGGASVRHMGALAVVGILTAVGVVHFGVLRSYQQQRLSAFVSSPNQPDAALLRSAAGASEYNLAESKITIGDGGLLGRGIGKGTQTNLSYVPEQRTDFIFTAVGEQVGLLGSVLLLALFALIVWRTWQTAAISRDLVGTLMCAGVLAMLMFQIFENVGMTMGIMPVAGIPLPLMSYGGSSVVATFAALGLVLSVRMRRFG